MLGAAKPSPKELWSLPISPSLPAATLFAVEIFDFSPQYLKVGALSCALFAMGEITAYAKYFDIN